MQILVRARATGARACAYIQICKLKDVGNEGILKQAETRNSSISNRTFSRDGRRESGNGNDDNNKNCTNTASNSQRPANKNYKNYSSTTVYKVLWQGK